MKLLRADQRFYKGNTHAHTTRSDGRLSPGEVCALYAGAGYDFLALTDHWQIAPTGRWDRMLLLSGIEYDFSFPDQVLHLVALYPDAANAAQVDRDTDYRAVIRAIHAGGGLAIAAHPAWSLNRPEFLASLDGVTLTEIYNSFSGTPWNAPRADSGCVLDLTATAGKLFHQVAADDSHRYAGEAGMSYVMVQAAALEPEPILDALLRGAFYASQGPEIYEAELTDSELYVRTSPVSVCAFCSNLIWVGDRCRAGSEMTEHVYRLNRDQGERYVRCEFTDAQGRRAWLSPVQL